MTTHVFNTRQRDDGKWQSSCETVEGVYAVGLTAAEAFEKARLVVDALLASNLYPSTEP